MWPDNEKYKRPQTHDAILHLIIYGIVYTTKDTGINCKMKFILDN